MTEIDLDAIQARADAATEGPWRTAAAPKGRGQRVTNKDGVTLFVNERHGQHRAKVDAVFIAHARTDVPVLLAALEEQDAIITVLREELLSAHAEVIVNRDTAKAAHTTIARIRRYVAREAFSQGGLPADVVDAQPVIDILDGKEPT